MRIRVLIGILILIFGLISTSVLASVAPKEVLTQGIFVALGLFFYSAIQFIPTQTIRTTGVPIYVGVCILLVVTLYAGHLSKGAVRWLSIGPIRIQLSEPAKPFLALTLAWFVAKFGLDSQRKILGVAILCAVSIAPVFLQPDLGSALVLSAIAGTIVLLSVKKLWMLLPWVAMLVACALLAWNFFLYDYQKQRIFSFAFPDQHADSSYNATQALIAVGSGKLWGRGLGHGVQSALKFLPEHHTDFFFASYAEELGFVGVCILLILYGTLFTALLVHLEHIPTFDRMYRYGIVGGLMFQAGVHIAMNIGLSPVTGIPLPLLSSGGSSFVAICIGLGIAMLLSQTRKKISVKEVRRV